MGKGCLHDGKSPCCRSPCWRPAAVRQRPVGVDGFSFGGSKEVWGAKDGSLSAVWAEPATDTAVKTPLHGKTSVDAFKVYEPKLWSIVSRSDPRGTEVVPKWVNSPGQDTPPTFLRYRNGSLLVISNQPPVNAKDKTAGLFLKAI